MCKLGGRDHNATSYSTETFWHECSESNALGAEIITLRAIALKRLIGILTNLIKEAEIITLRAIALKLTISFFMRLVSIAEIITLRAIALKLFNFTCATASCPAEIITLRAIALKRALPALAACSIAQRS